jgi:membrane associated rhomboid family serine protease
MSKPYLILNAGSSSLRFALFEPRGETEPLPTLRGHIEGIPAVFWQEIEHTPSAFPHLGLLASLTNLLWVTVGNMIGGMLVGIIYWFIYLRKARRTPSKPL